MSLHSSTESNTLDVFSKIESAIKSCKEHINWLEMNRVSSAIKALKFDENRLSKCIDDIEGFHRDMFVLPHEENKSTDTENTPAVNINMIKPENSVSAPECSRNVPMNEPDLLIIEDNSTLFVPECSTNKQEISRPSFIVKIPESKYTFGDTHSSKKESDDRCESNFSISDGKEVSSDGKEGSSDGKEGSSDGKEGSSDGKEGSSDGKEGSSDGKEGSSDGMELIDYMDEPDDDEEEEEESKKIVLNLLADREKEITELVLHLIQTFSSFQRRLRAAEASVSQPLKFFPDKPKLNIKKTLKALSGSVLYLDITVSKIHAVYSEMLRNLGEIFQ